MGHGPSKVRQRDVRAALRGALSAGIKINTIEVRPDGSLVLKTGKPDSTNQSGGNTWDDLLKEHDEDQTETRPKIR
jgi:hypothetical protein